MNSHNLVILCGGEGKRLWPLATSDHPKQFLQWTETTTLFDETVLRIQPFLDQGARLQVVTNKKYRHFFSAYESKIYTFFEEEATRNTAPAMLYALLGIMRQNPDAYVTFLPADHYIPDINQFVQTFSLFLQTIEQQDVLCAMGVKPTSPSIEYGYIEAEHALEPVKKVRRFHEKPDLDTANVYCQSQTMLWNTGVYGGKAAVFLEEFLTHVPELVNEVNLYEQKKIMYEEITKISFDFAVSEKSNKIMVVDSKYEWSDVGSLKSFFSLCPVSFLYKKKQLLIQKERFTS